MQSEIKTILQLAELYRAWQGRQCRNHAPNASPLPVPPHTDPPIQSRRIKDVKFKWRTMRVKAKGSDNHASTWGRDGNTYLVWGDGQGFSQQGPKRSLGISKRAGNSFSDIGGDDGKCYGAIALGNELYLWVGPGSMSSAIRQTYLAKWQLFANGKARLIERRRFFEFDRGIFHPTFIQHGPNNQWARDGWIYSLSTRGSKIKFEIQEGPGGSDICSVWLWRQPIGQLMDKRKIEYFMGRKNNKILWSRNIRAAWPVVQMHKSFLISCAYIKPINRYVMFNSFDWRSGTPFRSDLQVWDAEHVWGPWRKVKHWINWGEGHIYPSAFYWNIDTSTIQPDGRHMKLIFSGGGKLDAYHDMDIELILK